MSVAIHDGWVKAKPPRNRVRPDGKIRCCRCLRYLDADEFPLPAKTTGRMKGYCRPCERVYHREYYHRLRRNNIPWQKERGKGRVRRLPPETLAENERRYAENRQAGVALFDWLRSRGLGANEIARLAGMNTETVRYWRKGGGGRNPDPIQRLGRVVQCAYDLPVWRRKRNERKPHPAYAVLARRMQEMEP
jgi:hypothetical protein